MITYSMLDAELNRWATTQGLTWAHDYKDEQVRSLDVDIGLPRKAQIWIEISDVEPYIQIKAWDRKKRILTEASSPLELFESLDVVISKVHRWNAMSSMPNK